MVKTFVVFLSLCIILYKISGEKIVINTDGGADDAIAILLILRYEALKLKSIPFEVIGITCSYGNVEEEQVEKNVLKILSIAERSDIPIFGGAKKGFIEPFSSDYFFGNDGLGDVDFDMTITAKIDESKHSAVALVDMVKKNPGNVSIVSLGPLTNIGLAIALDSNFTRNVRHFYVMGGSVAGEGNVKPSVEFNFAADPESNLALFNAAAESQITLFPWAAAFGTIITKKWRHDVLGSYNSSYVKFLNGAESVSLSQSRETNWILSDGLLAACVIEASLVTSQVVRNVDPVTDGKTRGSLLVDHSMLTGKVNNTIIIQAINVTLYTEMLIRYLA